MYHEMRPVELVDVEFFRAQLGVECSRADPSRLVDWTGEFQSPSSDTTHYVVYPTTTSHVSCIARYCVSRGIAIVSQGGNTGLVGGSVPLAAELLLSLDRMASVESFDDLTGVAVTQAGATLSCLDRFVKAAGYTVPLDLGPRDRVTVGGAVATNAGGLRFGRYGSLHGSVLGLEVVLADERGTVLDLGLSTALMKDNTGLHLQNLFIGSEGTLGIVTRCALRCVIDYPSVQLVTVTCRDFEDVLAVLKIAKRELGEILSAFECLDRESLAMAASQVTRDEVDGLVGGDFVGDDSSDEFYCCIVECRGSCEEHDLVKIDRFSRLVDDGPSASARFVDHGDHDRIWKVRTSVSAGLKAFGTVFKFDISLPTREMHEMVAATRRRLEQGDAPPGTVTCGFGHIMDGNLHLNVAVADRSDDTVKSILDPWVYEEVTRRKGSISAEHGIGGY